MRDLIPRTSVPSNLHIDRVLEVGDVEVTPEISDERTQRNDNDVTVRYSVTRWLDYLFRIWAFTTI